MGTQYCVHAFCSHICLGLRCGPHISIPLCFLRRGKLSHQLLPPCRGPRLLSLLISTHRLLAITGGDFTVMSFLILLFLALHFPLLVCDSEYVSCAFKMNASVYQDGDLIIGGFFTLYSFIGELPGVWMEFQRRPSKNVHFSK